MRKYAIAMPLLALLAGALGYYLRHLELMLVFDSITGLPQQGAIISFALIWSSMAFMLVSILFAFRVKIGYSTMEGFENAFGTEPLAYPMLFLLIGIAWFGATVWHLSSVNALGTIPASQFVFSVLSAMSAISVALFAIEVYQDPQGTSKQALSAVPVIFLCYWLIFLYRQNASNPIILSYSYQCLAIIASTLGFYFTSGFVFGRAAPSKALLSFLAAIYFDFITLADNHSGSIKIILILMIAINVIYSTMLIANLQRK